MEYNFLGTTTTFFIIAIRVRIECFLVHSVGLMTIRLRLVIVRRREIAAVTSTSVLGPEDWTRINSKRLGNITIRCNPLEDKCPRADIHRSINGMAEMFNLYKVLGSLVNMRIVIVSLKDIVSSYERPAPPKKLTYPLLKCFVNLRRVTGAQTLPAMLGKMLNFVQWPCCPFALSPFL